MVTHALNLNELSTNDYALIGIHTVLNEYKLAYLLNKHLHIKFSKATYNLDFTEKLNTSFYTVYEYTNTALGYNWFLIANIYRPDCKKITGVFDASNALKYLVSEKKKIDYFLKIESCFDIEYIVKTIETINNIPQIITSYEVEVESLKSKDFLIF